MGWIRNGRTLLRRVAQARAARESALQRITLSELPDAPWPFEQIQVVFGEVVPTTEAALRWLRVEARRVGADAVLNVEVQTVTEVGYSNRSRRPTARLSADAVVRGPQHLATGTAVRKVTGS
jgi:uncharacterized protein YbjQ (UPF0145 family)